MLNLKIKTVSVFASALIFSGCQLMPPVETKSTFDIQEHHSYTLTGSVSINGQAFLKQNGGGIVTCAGNDVYLMPDTPYFQELLSIIKTRRKPKFEGDKDELKSVIRKTVCDAQGNFEFNSIPSENWMITTKVAWKVGYATQGGDLIKSLSTKGSTTSIKVMLTDADRVH